MRNVIFFRYAYVITDLPLYTAADNNDSNPTFYISQEVESPNVRVYFHSPLLFFP